MYLVSVPVAAEQQWTQVALIAAAIQVPYARNVCGSTSW